MRHAVNRGSSGLRDISKMEKRQRIREAAERLFSERGYENTTTREIAEAAKVGEATLFRYVANKQELLLLALGGRLSHVIETIRAADIHHGQEASTAQDFVERVLRIFEARANFFASDPENVRHYVQFGLTAGSQLGEESIRHGDELTGLTEKVLSQAMDAGLIPPWTDTKSVALNCNGIYIHEVLRSPVRGFPPETMWERLRKRILAQIAPCFLCASEFVGHSPGFITPHPWLVH